MKTVEEPLYSVLRIVAGFLFLWHGSQKLFGFPPAGGEIPLYIILFGGIVEFVGGVLIMLGFRTRWAAFIASGQMAYAYWSMHGTHAVLPIVNHGELAVLYCFLFLYICAHGGGAFSIDAMSGRGK